MTKRKKERKTNRLLCWCQKRSQQVQTLFFVPCVCVYAFINIHFLFFLFYYMILKVYDRFCLFSINWRVPFFVESKRRGDAVWLLFLWTMSSSFIFYFLAVCRWRSPRGKRNVQPWPLMRRPAVGPAALRWMALFGKRPIQSQPKSASQKNIQLDSNTSLITDAQPSPHQFIM